MKISKYWESKGKTIEDQKKGKIWHKTETKEFCEECCNKDRETNCDCYYRPNCPFCLGAGAFEILNDFTAEGNSV